MKQHSEKVEFIIAGKKQSFDLTFLHKYPFKVTENFSIYEVVFGTNFHMLHMIGKDARKFYDMVVSNFNDKIYENLKHTVEGIQFIRSLTDKRINITCGYRPVEWEYYRGRTGNSQHVQGKALDSYINGLPLDEYFKLALYVSRFKGVGINHANNFLHLDTRSGERIPVFKY